MTIFLCGFMGCGKSALGRALSKITGLPLIDTDDYIVEKIGMSIPKIFAEKGEPFFRATETEVIRELGAVNAIVACGGGVMVNPVNADAAKENGGKVVYLKQTFPVCYERIKDDTNRPIVQRSTKEELEALFQQRELLYTKHADYVVLAGNTPEESAERVLKTLSL